MGVTVEAAAAAEAWHDDKGTFAKRGVLDQDLGEERGEIVDAGDEIQTAAAVVAAAY